MAVTYSSILRLNLIVTGTEAGTWGDITNGNLGTLLEQAIASSTTFSVAGGDVTLTATNGSSDQSRCMALRVTGSPGVARNIIVPTATTPKAMYIVANGSNNTVTIKTGISIIVTSTVAGAEYRILSLGTTTSQAQWNTLAGTTGVTYSAGSVFTATGAGVGNGTVETAGVTVPSGSVFLVYYDTTFSGFRFVGQAGATANTPNTLVLRDASGNFAAGIITATTVNAGTLTGSYRGALGQGSTALTPNTGDNTPRVATTAFVQNSTASLAGPVSGGDSGLRTTSSSFTTVTVAAAIVTIPGLPITTQFSDYASGSTTVTLRAANSLIRVGQRVTGTNIPGQTFVNAVGTASVNAGSFIVGVSYTITNLGNTDWNVVFGTTGSTYNVGDTAVAAVAGSGTGAAFSSTITLSQATIGAGIGQSLSFTNTPAANTQIMFKTTGTLPAGLSLNTVYFVVNPNSVDASFSVSLTSGGAAITTTSAGTGTHSFGRLATTGSLELAGTLGVGYGGTGLSSITPNTVVVGNGSGALQLIRPSTNGNVLTSAAGSTVNAGSFVVGTQYTIASLGSPTATDFMAIGAASNTVGVVFTASGVGSGNGTATTNVWQSAPNNGLTSGSVVTATGASVLVSTTIPSWVKRITLMFDSISLTTDSQILVRLGTSSTIKIDEYVSTSAISGGSPTVSDDTTGFVVRIDGGARTLTGTMTLALITGNKWVSSHTGRVNTTNVVNGGGVVTLPGTLAQIQLVAGTGNFDNGSVNVLYD